MASKSRNDRGASCNNRKGDYMRFVKWLKVLMLRYERQHARYMQAFLRSELRHSSIPENSYDWHVCLAQLNALEAQEIVIDGKIKALRGE